MALIDKLTAIANAIRSKTGSTDLMSLDDMPTAIEGIQSGGGATEPYIEEVFDDSGDLVGATLVGYTKIRNNAFYECRTLKSVVIPSDIEEIEPYAFGYCVLLSLDGLPNNIKLIGSSCFSSCKNMAINRIPASVTRINTYAFRDCTGLTSITFDGTPTFVASTAFNGCTNITTINVPWSENALTGAPWGATNATINYNYTG